MSQWAHENPEAMAEIAALPPSQQNQAMRAAMPDPLDAADRLRDEARLETYEITTDQERTLQNLHADHDELEIRPGSRGRLIVLCIDYDDGGRVVTATHTVDPDGMAF